MKGEAQNDTYNTLGGSLEGFSVPLGLFKGIDSPQQQKGGSLTNLAMPDVTDVSAIPKGLYEKLMDLAKYGDNKNTPKKQTKGRNRKRANKKTRKL